MSVFIHPKALCESEKIGEGTRIWAFAHVLPGAQIGRDCNICDGVFVENEVVIGDAVTVKCGVQLWDGLQVGNGVFIGPNATFTNDLFPRSKQHLARYPLTIIEDDASIGANATILPGVRIGMRAMIGAGAVVLGDVPPCAILVGNPARIVGYANAVKLNKDSDLPTDFCCKLVRSPSFEEARGRLSVFEFGALPFQPARVFVVDRVPPNSVRGLHAHRECHQLLLALSGVLNVAVDDGARAFSVRLADSTLGLYVPPMTWSVQYGHSPDAVLAVMASHPYDRDDYICGYADFLAKRDIRGNGQTT